MQVQASTSASQARAILCALQAHDRSMLQTELTRVNGLMTPGDAAESERLELLWEIARELQSEAEPWGSKDTQVYRGLLQHLAAPATVWASGFQSVPGSALLQ